MRESDEGGRERRGEAERLREWHYSTFNNVESCRASSIIRYGEAMYCLDQALLLQPGHVRAHYSRGQVFSLVVSPMKGGGEGGFRLSVSHFEYFGCSLVTRSTSA